MRPKTIEIFLPSGDPQGIRVAAIATRTVCVYEVPRRLIDDFFKMTEAGQVGVYFLFGENEADGAPKVYIGQTGMLRTRLAQHNSGKEFWTRALVAVSRTNTLTSTHAGYLEWFSIQQARDATRYLLDNATAGGRPHTPDPLLADCVELHETIRVLLATLGYPVFEPIARPAITEASPTATPQADGTELYFAKGSGADARGLYTSEGFVVLAGSTGRKEIVPSFELHGYNRLREQIIQQGV